MVRGEIPLVLAANRASDPRPPSSWRATPPELVLAGAGGWVVARQIAREGAGAGHALSNLPGSFEDLGATLENAARLQAAGVTVAFMSGDAHNARNIKQAAGNAVAYGMPWKAALEAMTVVPARIWGLDDRYGTLEPGKDADVVVWTASARSPPSPTSLIRAPRSR